MLSPSMLSYFGPHSIFYSSFKRRWNQICEPSSSLKLNMPLKMYDCGNNIDSAHTVNNLQPGCTVL